MGIEGLGFKAWITWDFRIQGLGLDNMGIEGLGFKAWITWDFR
jgi:hypothetical protein